MIRAEDGTLRVDNRLHGGSPGASRDTLTLQPVTDALGLRYTDQFVARDKVVITEGFTELLYLRLFARLLDYDDPNVAPVTGEGEILTFIPFVISQGISFKVVVDSSFTRKNVQVAIPIPNDSFFVLAEHLGAKATHKVGIENLFSRYDLEMLLKRCGHETNDQYFGNVSNSEYAKATGIKTLVTREAYEAEDLEKNTLL